MEAAGKRWVVHGSRSDWFTLYGLGDCHLGSKSCSEHTLQHDIAIIEADPNALWVGLGDYGEFVGRNDKRFNVGNVAPWLLPHIGELGKATYDKILGYLDPIKDKCLGLAIGNHGQKIATLTDQGHLHSWLCVEMGVPNLQYSGIFDLIFCRRPRVKNPKIVYEAPTAGSNTRFRVWYHHGYGGGRTKAGKVKKLIDQMSFVDANLFFMGHVHDRTGTDLPLLGADEECNKIVHKTRFGAICGSYYRTYASGTISYADQSGYPPTSLGMAKMRLLPEERYVEVVASFGNLEHESK